jgi:hypothetical protein
MFSYAGQPHHDVAFDAKKLLSVLPEAGEPSKFQTDTGEQWELAWSLLILTPKTFVPTDL